MKSQQFYIIGCGGVGSWITPSLCRLVGSSSVTLVDGDRLEPKNLDRQLFTTKELGRNKAEALGRIYGCRGIPEWFSFGNLEVTQDDVIVGCADNNPARHAIIQQCDMSGCQAVIAANETNSAEAYWYKREWRDTGCDPRVYYREIVTDNTLDPRSAAIGCTGKAQQENPQLVTANFMAASLAQHLIVLWKLNEDTFDQEVRMRLPHQLFANLSRLGQKLVSDSIDKVPVLER